MFTTVGRKLTLTLLAVYIAIATEAQPPHVSRAEMQARAEKLSSFRWAATQQSQTASCLTGSKYEGPKYVSDYKPGDVVIGLPYDWGGDDDPETFSEKLASGKYAAGSHQRNECAICGHCTIGTDCSGLLSYCWRLPRHYGTTELSQFGSPPDDKTYNIFKDLKAGDALISPGHHVVLFDKYDSDGSPIVYEASGADRRVLRQKHPWAYFSKKSEPFTALHYMFVVD